MRRNSSKKTVEKICEFYVWFKCVTNNIILTFNISSFSFLEMWDWNVGQRFWSQYDKHTNKA